MPSHGDISQRLPGVPHTEWERYIVLPAPNPPPTGTSARSSWQIIDIGTVTRRGAAEGHMHSQRTTVTRSQRFRNPFGSTPTQPSKEPSCGPQGRKGSKRLSDPCVARDHQSRKGWTRAAEGPLSRGPQSEGCGIHPTARHDRDVPHQSVHKRRHTSKVSASGSLDMSKCLCF